LDRALEGRPPTEREACTLINTEGKDLQAVMSVASTIRDREKGRRISYSKKVFIPLTNMCRNNCRYCVFRKDPTDPAAKIMLPDQIMELTRLGDNAGYREALFVLGERPESIHPKAKKQLQSLGYSTTIDYLLDMCEMIVDKTNLLPHSNPGILSREELASLKKVNASMGLMLENSSTRLCGEGEPHQYSPGKNPRLRLETIEEAGRLKIPFTTGLLIGIGENPEELVNSLFNLKRLHDRYNHIQELIIQNFRAQPQTPMENSAEPTMIDVMKTVAVARIIFQGRTNIQTPPNLVPGDYREILRAGINDWGGISNITNDLVNPQEPWPRIETLRNITVEAGFQLKMRLPIYPEYIRRIPGYLPKTLEDKILRQVDDEGYVQEEQT